MSRGDSGLRNLTVESRICDSLRGGRSDVAKLNEKIYAELFVTPRSDPWLGLVQPDVYTALENGGVVEK